MTEQLPMTVRGNVPAVSAGRDALDVRMTTAVAIAKAGEMLPRSYRGQPGAVLLAIDWAERHDVSVMDAIHGVSWVQGRPVVDSTLQRALASNAGYAVRVTQANGQSATVKVYGNGGELIGEATYTMDEAKQAGLAGKDNWKKHPTDMMVARATTRAIKWFCPEALIGGAIAADELDEVVTDVVTDLAPVQSRPAVETVKLDVPDNLTDDVVDAEIVSDASDDDGKASTEARSMAKAALSDVKTAGLYQTAVTMMADEGIAVAVTKWTEAQAARIVAICDEVTTD